MRNSIKAIYQILTLMYLRIVYTFLGIEAVAQIIQNLNNPVHALRYFGAQIGNNTKIYRGVVIHAAEKDFSNLRIGSNVRIVRECFLDLTDCIEIDDEAIISIRCSLITHMNIHKSPLSNFGYTNKHGPIKVERGAVIFTNSTILMGVTIGECAMVAAGSVVIQDIPSWRLAGGVPAKVIKKLKPEKSGSV